MTHGDLSEQRGFKVVRRLKSQSNVFGVLLNLE